VSAEAAAGQIERTEVSSDAVVLKAVSVIVFKTVSVIVLRNLGLNPWNLDDIPFFTVAEMEGLSAEERAKSL